MPLGVQRLRRPVGKIELLDELVVTAPILVPLVGSTQRVVLEVIKANGILRAEVELGPI